MVSSPPSRQGRSPAEQVLAGSSIYALVSLLSDPPHCSLVKFTEYITTNTLLRIYALASLILLSSLVKVMSMRYTECIFLVSMYSTGIHRIKQQYILNRYS